MKPLNALQSVLSPAGPQAAHIDFVWRSFLWVSIAVYAVVMLFVATAIVRRRREEEREPETRRIGRVIAGATVLTAAILLGLLSMSAIAGHMISSLSEERGLRIKVTAHQWWWDIVYMNDDPSRGVTTANEIHIPVGRPIRFELRSADVIHSFWVPNLHGKTDLLPGDSTTTSLRADVPGVYRGQCAEFCGFQHAHMALAVVAESEEEFRRWYDHQLINAPVPSEPEQERGRSLFLNGPCATCHTVRGTPAAARFGPDLTHVARRRSIGAGTLTVTHESLAAWIKNPQQVKPGSNMPPAPFSADDLNALVRYVEMLQ